MCADTILAMGPEWIKAIEGEKFVEFKCPYCGKEVSFLEGLIGRVQECPDCFENIVVPAEESEFGRKLEFPIRTERLLLRRLQENDAENLAEVFSDEEIFRYTDGGPIDEAETQKWLRGLAGATLTTSDHTLYLGLIQQSIQKLIGYVFIASPDLDHAMATLDACVHRKFQKQGYGTETMRAAIKFCFEQAGMHRVSASCHSENAAARRMLEKAGMRLEGEFRQSWFLKGGWASITYYAILDSEYAQSTQEPPLKPKESRSS